MKVYKKTATYYTIEYANWFKTEIALQRF